MDNTLSYKEKSGFRKFWIAWNLQVPQTTALFRFLSVRSQIFYAVFVIFTAEPDPMLILEDVKRNSALNLLSTAIIDPFQLG